MLHAITNNKAEMRRISFQNETKQKHKTSS